MRFRLWNSVREHFDLALKCGAVLLLFLISVVIVACGASNTAQAPGTPVVTVTINLKTFSSPTPPLAPYSCGAWVTETTPAYVPNASVEVYAKFVQNLNGNPAGMNLANATAIVHWPDGSSVQFHEQTTSDGLAVFQVPLQQSAVNHVVLVEVDFTATGGQTCDVTGDQEAFFTATLVSPTPTPSPSPSAAPSVTPTGTVTPVSGTVTPTATATP